MLTHYHFSAPSAVNFVGHLDYSAVCLGFPRHQLKIAGPKNGFTLLAEYGFRAFVFVAPAVIGWPCPAFPAPFTSGRKTDENSL